MKNLDKIMIEFAYLELGLIPPSMEVDEAFSQLSPEEIRIAKRKFRKVYRKILKSDTAMIKFMQKYGSHDEPTPTEKRRRKEYVLKYFYRRAARPN